MNLLFRFVLVLICPILLIAQPDIEFHQLADFNDLVTDIRNADDERLFVTLQDGRIMIINNDCDHTTSLFIDLQSIVNDNGNERGLLGLAFHPNYSENGYFYVNYTGSGGHTRISRFQVSSDPNVGDPASELILLTINQPYANHNGGCIAFGPDGYLYIGMGDGGSGGDPQNNSQNPLSMLGKMLRIDVDHPDTANGLNYGIPEDNPFINNPDYLPEIWATGLRNPWRFSFDPPTGDLWIGDVGQDAWEEVDYQPASSQGGENYGWRCYEGTHNFNTNGCPPIAELTQPIFEYPHNSNGGLSITGGYVFRDMVNPDLYGYYICGDYAYSNYWLIRPGTDTQWEVVELAGLEGLATFGQGYDGKLYAGFGSGSVYLLGSSCGLINATAEVVNETCTGNNGSIQLSVCGTTDYEISWNTTATGDEISNLSAGVYSYNLTAGQCLYSNSFLLEGTVVEPPVLTNTADSELQCPGEWVTYQWYFNNTVITNATQANYTTNLVEGDYYVAVTNQEGCTVMSDTITIDISGVGDLEAHNIQVTRNGDYYIVSWSQSTNSFERIELVNVEGKTIFSQPIQDNQNQLLWNSNSILSKGMLFVKLVGSDRIVTKKILLN